MWVYDPPMTFAILSGRWVGDTGCPTKSSTKGLGVPQNRRRKVVTLATSHFNSNVHLLLLYSFRCVGVYKIVIGCNTQTHTHRLLHWNVGYINSRSWQPLVQNFLKSIIVAISHLMQAACHSPVSEVSFSRGHALELLLGNIRRISIDEETLGVALKSRALLPFFVVERGASLEYSEREFCVKLTEYSITLSYVTVLWKYFSGLKMQIVWRI
jgi:hypothetical protein